MNSGFFPLRLNLTILQTLRLFYIRYSRLLFNIKRWKKKKKEFPDLSHVQVYAFTPFLRNRRYTKKFYRRVLKKRYDREMTLVKFRSSEIVYSRIWLKTQFTPVDFKAYFHIKTIFNLNEFLLYDFYNYHSKLLLKTPAVNKLKLLHQGSKPWKKINMFYRIRYSIDIIRTHTLQFFQTSFRTDRKATIFFKGFNGLSVLSYVWFFEYSIPYFLVKLRLAESLGQGLMLTRSDVVFINHGTNLTRWSVISPGNLLQFVFTLFNIVRVKFMIIKFLNFFRRIKKFFKRTMFKPRKHRIKMPKHMNKSVHLVNSKHMHIRLMEVDYKSLSFVLLPYNSPTVYFSFLTLFWLNFWNYRLNVWKYDI